MESFDDYVRRAFLGALALVLIPAGVLVFIGLDAWARGVALGGAASLVNLLLMVRDIRRQAGSSVHKMVNASVGSYSLRMGFMAAALTYAAVDEGISLWAAIPALFCVQAVLIFGDLTGRLEGPGPSSG